MDLTKASFWGYKRENGRIGVRNHVVILPVDDLSNAACEAVANNIKGTLAIPHPYGRLQFGADLDLHFRTLIGTGCNPNVAAVVVICIEDQWAKRVADGIAATGKPVAYFGIEQHGDHDTILRASKKAKEFVQWASELRREERPLKDLWSWTTCARSKTKPGGGALPQRRGAQEIPVRLRPLPAGGRGAQDERPARLAAHQRQHRRRPHHHRGEGARQHPEDRPQVHGGRRARQGRGAHG